MAVRRIQRLARERMEQMDQDMEQRRLIASTDQSGMAADLPGTIAAGGTQAIGADDGVSRRTVVGHVQQAPQMPAPEDLYTPEQFAEGIKGLPDDRKIEILGDLMGHALGEIRGFGIRSERCVIPYGTVLV